MIDPDDFADRVADQLRSEPGSVFYSGRGAFSRPTDLYILGLNPGGLPTPDQAETIGRNLENWARLPDYYSAYCDDCWEGAEAGQHGMQPRVRHLFEQLGRDLRKTPASNVVFVRSRSEAHLQGRKAELLDRCWPVHDAVIRRLGIRTVLCFGATAGSWTRQALEANHRIDQFRESNLRGWTSQAHVNPNDVCVVTLTHPSRAHWQNRHADPTPLVRRALAR